MPILIGLLLLLASCSSANKNAREALYSNFNSGNYSKSLEILNSKNILEDDKSALLWHLERGMVYHSLGQYFQSAQQLQTAKKIARDLYTVRLKQKLASAVVNDNADLFYGDRFEKSLIHFYLALNYYLIYQQGYYESYEQVEFVEGEKELKKTVVPQRELSESARRQELFKARAELVDWNATQKEMQQELSGQSIYQFDLLSKLFGGLIHEEIGSRQEDRIALYLYKEAREILFKSYNGYKSINHKSVDFKKNYSSLVNLPFEKVKNEYSTLTEQGKNILNYIDYKILTMTKDLEPANLSSVIKELKPEKSIEQKLKDKNLNNVKIILQNRLVPRKLADKFNFGLEGAMRQISNPAARKFVAQVGVPVLSIFAANTLGLVPNAENWSVPGAYLGLASAHVAIENIGISFEMPTIVSHGEFDQFSINVYDEKDKLVQSQQLYLAAPIADIAEEAVASENFSQFTKTGTRVAMKHVAAIITAYTAYQNLKGSQEFLAKNAALLSYVLASKGIEASEKADTRQWSTLPQSIFLSEFFLPKGKYKLSLVSKQKTGDAWKESTKVVGDLVVDEIGKNYLINFRNL